MTQPVELRDGDFRKPVYARAGEVAYCANGHALGRFVRDAKTYATPAGELEPIPPARLGDMVCPHCGAATNVDGQYYFAVPGLFLVHIKAEGADRCPACGCPVKDFDKVPCK